jgi:4-hydroxy-tetrahydrodipicolinate reductase
MGSRLCALAQDDEGFILVAALARDAGAHVQTSDRASPASTGRGVHVAIAHDLGAITPRCADVVVDFSSDAGTMRAIQIASKAHAALLVGTTALTSTTREALRDESTRRAVLIAPNTSLGVAVLSRLCAMATRALGKNFDISIAESHHAQKKDAPSGTALRLASAIRDAGGTLRDDQIVSMRGGDIIGEHLVRFAGPGEVLELSHRATSRDLFARGALHAARWLTGAPAGLWTMDDALGLRIEA